MFSRKQILSAMAGAAMLALPVSAFANNSHHHDWNHHDRATHNAWVNRQAARNALVGPRYAANRYGWAPPASWYGAPTQRPVYQPYAAPNYGYSAPTYGYLPGASIGAANCNSAAAYSGSTPSQSPSWLMTKRYDTMRTIAQLRARGDSRGAARLVPIVTALNQRIGGVNRGLGCGLNPTNSLLSTIPYNGGSYYGNPSYGNSTFQTLGSLAGPMLGGIR
jgi:hypothetical protein